MNQCPICEEWIWESQPYPHRCPPEWETVYMDEEHLLPDMQEAIDSNGSEFVFAIDSKLAAEKQAATYIEGTGEIFVAVRKVGSDKWELFVVTAEFTIDYSTEKVEESNANDPEHD